MDRFKKKSNQNFLQMECNNNVIEGSLEQVQESVEYVKSKIGNMVPELGENYAKNATKKRHSL